MRHKANVSQQYQVSSLALFSLLPPLPPIMCLPDGDNIKDDFETVVTHLPLYSKLLLIAIATCDMLIEYITLGNITCYFTFERIKKTGNTITIH